MIMVWNIPNILTLSRVVIAVAFFIFALRQNWLAAFWLFAAAGFTDIVDGTLARLLDQKTRIGGFLDPMADKLLMLFGFVSLTAAGVVPLWLTSMVIVRDLVISGGIFYLNYRAIVVEYRPMFLSKCATFFQLLTLGLALLDISFGIATPYFSASIIAAAILTFVSGVVYFIKGLILIKGNCSGISKLIDSERVLVGSDSLRPDKRSER